MIKRYYRLFAVILALLILTSMALIGCSKGDANNAVKDENQQAEPVDKKDNDSSSDENAGGDESDSELASWQKDTSPFEFDIYFFAAWGTQYPWRGALVEKYITEDTGVTPNIIIPTGNEQEYLNVMIASDDLPDAMVLEWYAPETTRLI